ncbi:MAG TPA: response regulator [Polyangiaceae bacterium]
MSLKRPANRSGPPPDRNGSSGISALRPQLHSSDQRRRRILLVEGNPAIAQLYQSMLEPSFDVAIEGNPLSALTILSSAKVGYDLVLCDVEIPGVSGFEFVRRMKLDSAATRVPVVLFNGEEESAQVIRAIQLGVRHYIPKTCSLGDLTRKISALLSPR